MAKGVKAGGVKTAEDMGDTDTVMWTDLINLDSDMNASDDIDWDQIDEFTRLLVG